jgi:PLD-like domain
MTQPRRRQENDGRNGVWFNRGAIASQAFADQFGNKSLTEEEYNDPANKEVAWLSRGLLEACLQYIDDTPKGDALRVVAYEFTYERVILTLKNALQRGVDVKIVYHDTPANNKAIQHAALPKTNKAGEQILFKRTRPQTPHNKFVIRLKGGKTPVATFTGSTNFTPSGFLDQCRPSGDGRHGRGDIPQTVGRVEGRSGFGNGSRDRDGAFAEPAEPHRQRSHTGFFETSERRHARLVRRQNQGRRDKLDVHGRVRRRSQDLCAHSDPRSLDALHSARAAADGRNRRRG